MSRYTLGQFFQLILSLFSRKSSSDESATPSSQPHGLPSSSGSTNLLIGSKVAWAGHKNVTPKFVKAVDLMRHRLLSAASLDDWMACMAFETGPTKRFLPDARNPNSSATGLIQFMAATAISLGTTVEKLAKMDQLEQLEWVEKYFTPYAGRLNSLEDLYMAILWPAAVGKPNDYVLFREGTKQYAANSGLDLNRDGLITKAEASAKVRETLQAGLQAPYYVEV